MPITRLDAAQQHGRLDVRGQEGEVADLREPGTGQAETMFLRRCGVPDDMIEFARTISGAPANSGKILPTARAR